MKDTRLLKNYLELIGELLIIKE